MKGWNAMEPIASSLALGILVTVLSYSCLTVDLAAAVSAGICAALASWTAHKGHSPQRRVGTTMSTEAAGGDRRVP
jgi:hypothetical protein